MPPRPRPIADRFWPRVTFEPNTGCWLWTGPVVHGGYGTMGNRQRAHRVSWLIHYGPIPGGLFVCHRCDTPPCVNPRHLFLGTQKDNMQDATAKGRRSSGPSHLRSGENGPASKLTWPQVRELRSLKASGVTYEELSRRFSICSASVWNILANRTWREPCTS